MAFYEIPTLEFPLSEFNIKGTRGDNLHPIFSSSDTSFVTLQQPQVYIHLIDCCIRRGRMIDVLETEVN